MKILMAYMHYPCSIARFWKRGFRRLGHEVHSVGYCTGGQQAWPGTPMLDNWVDRPDIPVVNSAERYVIDEGLRNASGDYDLFVNVDAVNWWMGKTKCPKVIVGTDPHCIGYDGQRADCDMFVCMQDCYSNPGDVWIPYAYDEEWHFHADVPVDHDVTFYGVMYANRINDLRRLENAGIIIECTGLPEYPLLRYPVFSEGSPLYSAGHLAYCRPSLQDLPTRFFEAMVYGNIPLITAVPDLRLLTQFAPGEHYEIFEDGDLVETVRKVLADPELEGRKRNNIEAVRGHSWADRAQMLLDVCGERGLIKSG